MAKVVVVQWNGLGKGWDQGHLSMKKKYARVQVQRGAQKPKQRQKREKPRKRKSCENRGVTSDRNMRLWDVLLSPGIKQRCLYLWVQGLFTLRKVFLMQLSVALSYTLGGARNLIPARCSG